MIRHVNYKPVHVYSNLVRQFIHKKRRRITSCYTYSSHGLFYALFLLIYGMILCLDMMLFVNAEPFNQVRQFDENIDETNSMNQLVVNVNSDEAENEYYDDNENRDYLNLISNKSGKYVYLLL